MKAFYYLNYFIYRFYESRDADPFIYSLNGSSLLIVLNIITLYYGVNYFILNQEIRFGYSAILILFAVIGANYLTLYNGKRYERIFTEMRRNDNSISQTLCLTYIIVSILGCLFLILLMKYQKYGSL